MQSKKLAVVHETKSSHWSQNLVNDQGQKVKLELEWI